MTSKPNGERPAFPAFDAGTPGLSKREYFAGLALQGILANPTWNAAALMLRGITDERAIAIAGDIARQYADALLAELAKEPKP